MTTLPMLLAHILIVYAVFIQPVIGLYSYRGLRRRAAVEEKARIYFYLRGIAAKWLWVLAVAVVLLLAEQPAQVIGLQMPTSWFATVFWFLLFGLFILVTIIGYKRLIRQPEDFKQIQEQAAVKLLPKSSQERWLWIAAAITAGVSEEILYRGFLLFYLTLLWPGAHPLVAIVLSGLVFGLGHFYQGWQGSVITGVIGALLMAVYITSGSLLVAIVIHALVDLRALFFVPPAEAEALVDSSGPLKL
ncbi:MAG: CPBP family intramembrane metalloprotease [Ktedonobacteraceae bacterium]|nr:CPBP family intramembrane metalloprotease [Ktedonobacteraceae bacterium]